MRRAALVVACALLFGCSETAPARDQWVVVASTDAPIPQFGQLLYAEVLPQSQSACPDCAREFGAAEPSDWPLSFGVEPLPDGTAPLVDVFFFRASVAGSRGPTSDRAIEALVHLPPAHGVTVVQVPLSMQCFGVPANPADGTSCDPSSGELRVVTADATDVVPLSPDTWAAAAATGCAKTEPAMACIDAGEFLMGAPDYLPMGDASPFPEQLVTVDAFLMDQDEMTVGALQTLIDAHLVAAPPFDGDSTCTWNLGDPDLPVNCVTRAYADGVCKAQGKELPTEAQWEWAAGNGAQESAYPWLALPGTIPLCDAAIVGRAPSMDDDLNTSSACRVADATGAMTPAAPVAGGSAFDMTGKCPADGINCVANLGGNVGEWVQDNFVPYTDTTCWGLGSDVHSAPCLSGTMPVFRGGAWSSLPAAASATFRSYKTMDGASADVGFRCVE
ncbi:MAG TPA: formylglycine-generating enzyme family protein [Byssovorax sp.]